VRKYIFCLIVCFFTSPLQTNIFAKEVQIETRSLHTEDYVNAAAEVCIDVAVDLVDVPKEERKKRKRRFFKKLLVKLASLAMTAFANSRISKGVLPQQEMEEEIAESLLQEIESSPSRSFWTSFLCVLKILYDICEARENKEDPERVKQLLQDLREVLTFDNLLEQCGRAGSFLTRLKNAQTDEDWKLLAEGLLRATRQAAGYVNDLFEVVQFYTKEKCREIFGETQKI
jgi:hypothetical protein